MPENICRGVTFEPPDFDSPRVMDVLISALMGITSQEFLRNERAGKYDIYEEETNATE